MARNKDLENQGELERDKNCQATVALEVMVMAFGVVKLAYKSFALWAHSYFYVLCVLCTRST